MIPSRLMDADIAKNKKALHDFKVIEKFEAGIELKGTEVKSIREGKINLRDSFARVENGQVFLYGCDIQAYSNASFEQHAAKRPRRLLLWRVPQINRPYGVTAARWIRSSTWLARQAGTSGHMQQRVRIEVGGDGSRAAAVQGVRESLHDRSDP